MNGGPDEGHHTNFAWLLDGFPLLLARTALGFVISEFALVWIANVYMGAYNLPISPGAEWRKAANGKEVLPVPEMFHQRYASLRSQHALHCRQTEATPRRSRFQAGPGIVFSSERGPCGRVNAAAPAQSKAHHSGQLRFTAAASVPWWVEHGHKTNSWRR